MGASGQPPCGIDQWLGYIQGLHFRSIDLTLDRVRRVAHAMRLRPGGRVVVVAGTNGKGSSVAYLEAIYLAAGYRVGAYTSPHLVRYNERVRLDGVPVGDADLEASFWRVETARGDIPLTYFEFGTLVALDIFARQAPDIVILEVGMGGRLDATNIVDGDVALITEIGLDHQQWLGHDVETIAREKAGIMRYRGRAVSSGMRPPEALSAAARRKRCELWQLGTDFGFEAVGDRWHWLPGPGNPAAPVRDLPLPGGGAHQLANAAGAVAVVRRLDAVAVADRQIADGLSRARKPGRLQVIGDRPQILCDVSHNADGIAALAAFLAEQPVGGCTRAVFSMLGDKDIAASVARIAPLIDAWHVAPLVDERAADADTVAAMVEGHGRVVQIAPSVIAALEGALATSGPADRVVAFGSFHLVGDIMRHLNIDPFPAQGPDDS